jgi:hypothetical protein
MKIGIIGGRIRMRGCSGLRGAARQGGVLVDPTRERAKAVATEIRCGGPMPPMLDVGTGLQGSCRRGGRHDHSPRR